MVEHYSDGSILWASKANAHGLHDIMPTQSVQLRPSALPVRNSATQSFVGPLHLGGKPWAEYADGETAGHRREIS